MKLIKLTKTDEFSSVFSFRKRVYGAWLIANIKPNSLGYHRYGLVVAKKVAKHAVRRNYMKRVLRALLQQEGLAHTHGCDVILQVKKCYTHADFADVKHELRQLLVKINRFSSPVSRE